MTTNPILSMFLLGMLLPATVSAMPPGPPPPNPIAKALDKNHDHELSAREIKNASKALLKLDEDRDDALSAEELRPEPPRGNRRRDRDDDADAQGRPPGPPPSKLVEAIDTDGDGALSTSEITAAPEALLSLDADDDGELSAEEAGLGRPGGPGGQGGPPPGGPRR